MMKNFTINFRQLVLLGLVALFCGHLDAQDPHFSQVNASPLQLNPAMAGVFEGQWRVAVNYREQWRAIFSDASFKTYGASYDMRFYARKNDFFTFGLSVLSDQAGASHFTQTQGHATLSYMKQIAGGRGRRDRQYLSAGASLGIGQTGINWNTLRWSTQFDGEGYDGNLASGENLDINNNTYADINAGLMWYALMGNNRSAYLGAAMNHINTPNISLFEGERDPYHRRYTIHGGGEVPINRDVTLLPGFRLLRQGPSLEADLGVSFRFTNRDFGDVALRAGVWGRMVNGLNKIDSDAVTIVAALEWERWQLGLSYDVTISPLRVLNDARGAFEMSLIYIQPQPRRGGIYCPIF